MPERTPEEEKVLATPLKSSTKEPTRLPTDEEMMLFSVNDPDIEEHRNQIRQMRRSARWEFIAAAAAEVEWSTQVLNTDNDQQQLENRRNAQAAQQRKENMRRRYGFLDELLSGMPKVPSEKSR